jgi:hypothetical protein
MGRAAFVSLVLVASSAAAEPATPWLSSLDDAMRVARERDRPILVVLRCER